MSLTPPNGGIGKLTPLVVLMLPLTLLLAVFWSIGLRHPYLDTVRELNSDWRGDYE